MAAAHTKEASAIPKESIESPRASRISALLDSKICKALQVSLRTGAPQGIVHLDCLEKVKVENDLWLVKLKKASLFSDSSFL